MKVVIDIYKLWMCPKPLSLDRFFFLLTKICFVIADVADEYILINILRIIILKNDKDFAVLHQDIKQLFFKVDKLVPP